MGVLLTGLVERKMINSVNIMLVSDHGMATTSADSVVFLDDFIDLSDIRVVDWTPVGSIIPKIEIKNNNLVKGIGFEGLRVLGSPNPGRSFLRVGPSPEATPD